jgi:hypothetical protein
MGRWWSDIPRSSAFRSNFGDDSFLKHLALIILLPLSLTVFGQEVPPFLKGYDYIITKHVTDDGVPYDAFEVNDITQAKALKRNIKQLRCRHWFWIHKNGLRITRRSIGEWTVMTFTGIDFRNVSVFKQ